MQYVRDHVFSIVGSGWKCFDLVVYLALLTIFSLVALRSAYHMTIDESSVEVVVFILLAFFKTHQFWIHRKVPSRWLP